MNLPSTDVVIVGAGACGSLMAKELAAHGFSVVVLEAGKRYDPARDFGIAGGCGPFAPEPYRLPMPPHRMNWHAQLLARGARQLGAHPFAPPIAINSTEYDGRPACIYCGWCASGCTTGAKATATDTYLAKGEKLGAHVLSEAFVTRVNYDAARGRVTGVIYRDDAGREHELRARLVVLSAHAVETPRLL